MLKMSLRRPADTTAAGHLPQRTRWLAKDLPVLPGWVAHCENAISVKINTIIMLCCLLPFGFDEAGCVDAIKSLRSSCCERNIMHITHVETTEEVFVVGQIISLIHANFSVWCF